MAIPCQDLYLYPLLKKGVIKIEYIYQIENLVTGIKYYGRTNNPQRRKTTHFRELEQNKHINSKLQNAFNKYGKENFVFTILEEIEDEGKVFEREEYYLNLEEEKYNISKSSRSPGNYIHYGSNNGFYGKHHSEETKSKIGSKASIRCRGEGNPFYGKKHTEETKRLIAEKARETFKGVPKTEEWKKKKRACSPKNIPIVIDGKEYISINEAARELNVDRKTISYRLNSKSEKFSGYRYK